MIKQLFRFHGGVKPDTHKDESAREPIRRAPLPDQLAVPLRNNTRAIARCVVEPGQRVLKGQRIGEADGVLGTACHAPTSGVVSEVTDHTMAHPSGLPTDCIIIQPDGEDEWTELKPFDPSVAEHRVQVRNFLRDSGLVGLGGAAFPSHIKVGSEKSIDTLILNGAECEPWITADDRLMRERADEIMHGAEILQDLVGARRVLVGIEDNKHEAIEAMRMAGKAREVPIEVVAVPTLYPAGGEKQLIRTLTGIEIPHGKLGFEYGVQCFNVGTAYAVKRAIKHGEPLISRIVTLTGNVTHPGNYEVLIGTPIEALLPVIEPKADTDRYIQGGPMMGFALPDLSVPIVKAANCIIAASPKLFPPPEPEQPCIRCGECADACPADLQPFELYWYARSKNFGKAQEYNLFDCIECGCCAYVCPSHIPLVDYYRFAKSEIWAREREHKAADAARERFEFRNYRQEREKAEKAARMAAKAAETRAKKAAKEPETAEQAPAEKDSKKALIDAAIAKAKRQKAETTAREKKPPEEQAAGEAAQTRQQSEPEAGQPDSDATSAQPERADKPEPESDLSSPR